VNFYAYWWPVGSVGTAAKTTHERALASLDYAEAVALANPLAIEDELIDLGTINEAIALMRVAEASTSTSSSSSAQGVIWHRTTRPKATQLAPVAPRCTPRRRAHHAQHRCRRMGSSTSTIDPPALVAVAPNSSLLALETLTRKESID
jgi:hypothetical protein